MAVQDPVFWRTLHDAGSIDAAPEGQERLRATFDSLGGDASLQRQSATLLLAIALWSRPESRAPPPIPAALRAAPSSEQTAPFADGGGGSGDGAATANGSHANSPQPGTLQPSPALTGHDPATLEANWQPDPDEYPRHGEALARARARLKLQRHFHDPFAGPTPMEAQRLLSPAGRSRLTGRHLDPTLGTPGSPGLGQGGRMASLTDDQLLGPRADYDGRPADNTSVRLLQDVLMFARRTGMRQLQSRNIDRVGGRLSLGHVGAVYIDADGKPGELGVSMLPPPRALGWRKYLKCACLDNGVALLGDTRGEVYFAGSFREHVPAPPKGRSSGMLLSGQSSLAASPANDAADPANHAGNVIKLVANNALDVRGNRARLAVLKADGSIQMLSPTAIKYSVGGVMPFAACARFTIGQANDVFYVEETGNRLGKCSSAVKACTTPRHATTMLQRAVFDVAAGYHFALAVDTRGCIWAQGRNEKGQLGVGSARDAHAAFTPDTALRGRHFVVGVACGRQHSVAVTANGSVYVAGDNRYGQLGLTPEEADSAPQKAPGSVNRFTKLTLPGPCVGVACGTFSTFFVLRDGTVLGCGNNDFGQLGLMPPTSIVSPPQVIDAIAARGGILGIGSKALAGGGKVAPNGAACCNGCAVM